MTNKTKNSKYLIIASVLLNVILVLGLMAGPITAKYKTEKRITGEVKFTAKLADRILIQEHEAVRQTDGSYVLDADKIVEQQSYSLMPGVDIPKDPFITIEGKTAIPAYLYVEVVEGSEFPAEVAYKLTSDWTLLKTTAEGSQTEVPVTGPNGGKVYVYKDILTNENTETADGVPVKFQTLDFVNGSVTDTLEVSDALPRGTQATLSFYAYICQKYTDDKVVNFGLYTTAELTTAAPVESGNPNDGASAGGN